MFVPSSSNRTTALTTAAESGIQEKLISPEPKNELVEMAAAIFKHFKRIDSAHNARYPQKKIKIFY